MWGYGVDLRLWVLYTCPSAVWHSLAYRAGVHMHHYVYMLYVYIYICVQLVRKELRGFFVSLSLLQLCANIEQKQIQMS